VQCFFKTSGSIKERTQTRTKMGISCQQNGHWHGPWHWAATNHLFCQSSAAGRCAGSGCALIRQLANTKASAVGPLCNVLHSVDFDCIHMFTTRNDLTVVLQTLFYINSDSCSNRELK